MSTDTKDQNKNTQHSTIEVKNRENNELPNNEVERINQYFKLVTTIILFIEFALAIGSLITVDSFNKCNLFFDIVGGTYFLFCSILDHVYISEAVLFFLNVLLYVPSISFIISSIILFISVIVPIGTITEIFVVTQYCVVPELIFRFFMNLPNDTSFAVKHLIFLAAHYILQERRIWQKYHQQIKKYKDNLSKILKIITPLKQTKK